ncbi:hypothetical protein VLK31_06090 [Variovorax sp. H27-G14]|uniref:hypothetical protein n=1 Tax=Variovorax sp. H27-G14 TaxID=3111914 RepID=UPI0038FC0537
MRFVSICSGLAEWPSYDPAKLHEAEMPGASEIERVVAALKTLAVQPWPESARFVLKWNDVAKSLPGIGYEAFFHAHRLATRNVFHDIGLNTSAIEALRSQGFAVVVDANQGEAASCVRIEVGVAWLDLSRKLPGLKPSSGMYELRDDDGHC